MTNIMKKIKAAFTGADSPPKADPVAPPGQQGGNDAFGKAPHGTLEKDRLDRALLHHMRGIEQSLHLKRDSFTSLVKMCSRVHQSLHLSEVLTVILDQAVSVTRPEAIRLFLVDEETGHLDGYIPDMQGNHALAGERYDPGRGIAGWTADNNVLVIVADVERDARFDAAVDGPEGVSVQSVLAAPLRVKDRCIGVLELVNKADGSAFSEEDALLTSFFTDQAACAVHNARLYEQVEARLDQSDRLRKQQVETEKYRALEELSAGVSHDFRNLLNAILGFSEILFLDIEDETARKDVMEIINATNTATHLVDQIHTFSRQRDQKKIRVGINHLVTRSLKQFQAGLTKTIDIQHDLKARGQWLMADPSQLHQALMNVLENAADAVPDHGGTIRIATDRIAVVEDDPRHEDVEQGIYIELIVQDNGRGIEADVMKQMFEPYFTTKARGVGTGLGLPLVRGVVQSHGGAISVDSKPGEGTTVHLLLPSVEFERRVDADAYQGLPTGTESILLVEDEHLVMLAVEKMLNHLGYTVVTSANAEDALELYRKQSGELDLVITDWSLPGMRGDRLAAMMLDVKPSVRVIVYSAYAGDLKNEMLKSDGIRDVLRKPVDIRELAQKVRKALDA